MYVVRASESAFARMCACVYVCAPVAEVIITPIPLVAPADAKILVICVRIGAAITVRSPVITAPGPRSIVERFELIVARFDLDCVLFQWVCVCVWVCVWVCV